MKIDTPTARSKITARREPFWQQLDRGLALGYRAGPATWVVRVQIEGRKTYHSLGLADDGKRQADGGHILNFSQAVEMAHRWRGRALKADNVASMTVEQALNSYTDYLYRAKAKSTAYATETRMRKHLASQLGATLIGKLTPRAIAAWHEGLVPAGISDPEERRKKMDSANHCLTALKAALNRAATGDAGVRDDAWRAVKPFKGVTAARKVFLTEDEAQRLLDTCEDTNFRNLVEGGLLTGARFGELANMKVRDLDLAAYSWSVAISKTGPRESELTTAAINLLRRVAVGRQKAELIFTRRDGGQWTNHNVRPPMERAIAKAGLDPTTTFYALRHTTISWLLKAGTPMQAIAENVGTSVRMIEKHYGKFLRQDKRSMLEAGMPDLKRSDEGDKVVQP